MGFELWILWWNWVGKRTGGIMAESVTQKEGEK